MKILVCIKQVPDIESNIVINENSSWIVEEGKIAFRMNRYDEYALEEALLIKDAEPGTVVDAISIGPGRAAAVLKRSLEKGADNAVHILCENPLLSAADTSSLLAEYSKDKNYDIIFAGVMSEDLMQSQVGPMLAAKLHLPCAVSAVGIKLMDKGAAISAELELEGGIIETVEIKLPAVITVQTGINLPRYPSLSNVMRARSMNISLIKNESIIRTASPDEILSIEYPPVSTKGIIISGSSEEKAEKLIDIFHERALL